jgi:hypothetical protein
LKDRYTEDVLSSEADRRESLEEALTFVGGHAA